MRGRTVTETAFDHPAVEQLEGIACAEPERSARPPKGFAAVPVARKCPGEHVVAVDARPGRVCPPCQGERVPETNALVDVEERRIEVRLDAVGDEQALDDAY